MPTTLPDSPVPPLFVRTRHLPAILGISERKAKQLIASGAVASVKLDGCTLIPVAGLHAFEARLREQAA